MRDLLARWILQRAIQRASDRFQTRIMSCSIQDGHLHMTVVSASAQALGKAMQGLGVRIAKHVNRALDRRGAVFDDHYQARLLDSRGGTDLA